MRRTYQITEYGSFVRNKEIPGYVSLPENTFDDLEEFLLTYRNRETDALELMSLSAKKGIGKVITAKNYVGVISMNDQTTIEILPKIYSGAQVTIGKTKKLLIDMLKTLRDAPFKTLQTTNVDIEKMSIFEIFIRMFVNEVFRIVKHGLKCSYETIQSNGTMFKGKMLFEHQIKYNYAHKELCYVQFDEFNTNQAENRLIKSALLYLYRYSNSIKNKSDIKTLLASFSTVDPSKDYIADFDKVTIDRHTKDYETALKWCKVFLQGKTFTAFSGSQIAFALLFPMESLFESYIASLLRRAFRGTSYALSAQDRTYHLFDEPSQKFLIKPDIVLRNTQSDSVFVMDTKWKLLSAQKPNYGISQADMYQMYAYQKKYSANNVTLLYPMTENLYNHAPISFSSADGVTVKARFIDLFQIDHSIGLIKQDIMCQ